MTSIVRRLAAVACTLVLFAGCSESDSELDADATADDTSSTTDDGDAGADDAEQAAIADAEAAMEAQGFSAAGARCMVESMISNGVSLEDLEQIEQASPDQEFLDAAAQAGAVCAADIADDIPQGAIDLNNPVIREQFVRTFSQSTGLTLEQADCVAQYFIDNDVDYDALIAAAGGAEPDAETARQVSEAMERCA